MGTKHFNHVVEKIAAAKRIADQLADKIAHHGIEGQIRELAVRDVIAPFMTQGFVCGTGKIIDTCQQLSRQMDIVIYHRRSVPPILVDDISVSSLSNAFATPSRSRRVSLPKNCATPI